MANSQLSLSGKQLLPALPKSYDDQRACLYPSAQSPHLLGMDILSLCPCVCLLQHVARACVRACVCVCLCVCVYVRTRASALGNQA